MLEGSVAAAAENKHNHVLELHVGTGETDVCAPGECSCDRIGFGTEQSWFKSQSYHLLPCGLRTGLNFSELPELAQQEIALAQGRRGQDRQESSSRPLAEPRAR